MTEPLQRRLARARVHIDAGFDEAQIARGADALDRRIARRRVAAQTGYATAVLALLALAWVAARPAAELPVAATPPSVVRTLDGSLARALEPDSELRVERQLDDTVELSLARGAAHFEVTPRPERRYRVRVGEVEVSVLGTAFDVQRRGGRVFVRVDHGAVSVTWPGGDTVLRAGDQGWFPPAVRTASPATEQTRPAASEASAASHGAQLERASPRAAEPWRALARAGKHGEAFRSLARERVEDLEGLLLAADAARLSGHPREAVQYLEHLVRRYPDSAPARLAAFTLGRLALNELDEPALAAKSFAHAYALDPNGPLAEDALAREAEAHARAGDAQRARRAADRYLARFPQGARRAEMERVLSPQPR